MQPIPNYGNERMLSRCVYCGCETGTRDHVPQDRVLTEINRLPSPRDVCP